MDRSDVRLSGTAPTPSCSYAMPATSAKTDPVVTFDAKRSSTEPAVSVCATEFPQQS